MRQTIAQSIDGFHVNLWRQCWCTRTIGVLPVGNLSVVKIFHKFCTNNDFVLFCIYKHLHFVTRVKTIYISNKLIKVSLVHVSSQG